MMTTFTTKACIESDPDCDYWGYTMLFDNNDNVIAYPSCKYVTEYNNNTLELIELVAILDAIEYCIDNTSAISTTSTTIHGRSPSRNAIAYINNFKKYKPHNIIDYIVFCTPSIDTDIIDITAEIHFDIKQRLHNIGKTNITITLQHITDTDTNAHLKDLAKYACYQNYINTVKEFPIEYDKNDRISYNIIKKN